MRFIRKTPWVAGQIADLVDGGVTPGEIVVLAPIPSTRRRSPTNLLVQLHCCPLAPPLARRRVMSRQPAAC